MWANHLGSGFKVTTLVIQHVHGIVFDWIVMGSRAVVSCYAWHKSGFENLKISFRLSTTSSPGFFGCLSMAHTLPLPSSSSSSPSSSPFGFFPFSMSRTRFILRIDESFEGRISKNGHMHDPINLRCSHSFSYKWRFKKTVKLYAFDASNLDWVSYWIPRISRAINSFFFWNGFKRKITTDFSMKWTWREMCSTMVLVRAHRGVPFHSFQFLSLSQMSTEVIGFIWKGNCGPLNEPSE